CRPRRRYSPPARSDRSGIVQRGCRMRWMVVLLAVMVASCVDSRSGRPGDRPGPQGDGGPAAPADPVEPPPPPPGGVSMAVGAATWSLDGSHLFVEAAVGNAADGAPAPLVWTAFTLETEIGAILDAASLSAETCPGGLSIAPGATLRCEVGFAVPSGHRPVRLHYRADAERTAQAPVPACSPSTPQGLCEPGMACEAGRCIAPCSAHEPDGFCFGADQCIEGACRSLCSFENPHGWCADGACVEGRCDASCYALDYLA